MDTQYFYGTAVDGQLVFIPKDENSNLTFRANVKLFSCFQIHGRDIGIYVTGLSAYEEITSFVYSNDENGERGYELSVVGLRSGPPIGHLLKRDTVSGTFTNTKGLGCASRD